MARQRSLSFCLFSNEGVSRAWFYIIRRTSGRDWRCSKSWGEFDAIFLQKKLSSVPESLLLRRQSGRLIFDFDDAIMYRYDARGATLSLSRLLKFRVLVRFCDLVTAGNRVLKAHAKGVNPNVAVVPTGVAMDVPVKANGRDDHSFKVGWIGGTQNLRYLQPLVPVLEGLFRKIPLELVIVSGRPVKASGVRVTFVRCSYDTTISSAIST